MPVIKVDNKGGKGNPNHDSDTGEFTSKEGGSGKEQSIIDNITPERKAELLRNLAKVREEIAKHGQNNVAVTNLKEANDLSEAERIGNEILGREGVKYSNNTDIRCANEMNRALYDLHNDFPELFEVMLKYGDANLKEQTYEDFRRIIVNRRRSLETISKSLNLDAAEQERFEKVLTYESDEWWYHVERESGCLGSLLYGAAEDAFYSVSLNVHYTKNKDSYDASMLHSEQTGFHYASGKGGAYAVATHELGHLIDHALRKRVGDLGSRQISAKLKQLKVTGKRSRYAMKNDAEFVAEAFSDVYSNGDQAQTMNKELVKFYKEVYANGIQ